MWLCDLTGRKAGLQEAKVGWGHAKGLDEHGFLASLELPFNHGRL